MVIKILFGVLIGAAIGAVLGYLGKCSSGTCPLTANPYRGAIYGAAVGTLLVLIFSGLPKRRPTSLQEKSTPVKEAAGVPSEKSAIPKVSTEGSDAVDTDSESDSNATVFKQKRSALVEPLTKESFLQKVFNYEQNEQWKFEGKLPCIVDFYADWCAPCKMVEPILRELAQEYQGKLNIYRVDTQAEPELAAAFGIQSIPSMLFVPLNDKPQMAVGALPKKTLKKAIEDVLKVE
jgi:thioredoxin 1